MKRQPQEFHGATLGGKQPPLYQVWAQIKQRCFNKKCPKYENYGKRGILMDPRWKESFITFQSEIEAKIGERPSKKHSLGRIDNDKGYWPDNVRWESYIQQNRNTRKNHLIAFEGGQKTLAEVSEKTGIDHRRLQDRVARQGLSHEEAVKRPFEGGSLFIEWKGEYHSLSVWARKLNKLYQTLYTRIFRKGMSVDEAFTT
jgi:hypothetical protein